MIAKCRYLSSVHKITFCYPAEDHYHKFSLLDEDLYLHQHNRDDIFYRSMHQLYLNIRNLSYEIEAALIHTKDVKHNKYTIRDLKNIDYKLTIINNMVIELIIEKYKFWEKIPWYKKVGKKKDILFRREGDSNSDKIEKTPLEKAALEKYVTKVIVKMHDGNLEINSDHNRYGHIYKDYILKTMDDIFSDNNKYCKKNQLCSISDKCDRSQKCFLEECPIYKDCLIECGESETGFQKILIINDYE